MHVMLPHIRSFVFVAALAGSLPLASRAAAQQETLYRRLGGYDAIAAVVDDFIGRLAADPELAKFFAGLSRDSQHRVRQLVVDQLCAATGGPCVYIGRDMRTAHQGLHITEADWDRSVNHLIATLNRFHVPEAERNALLEALGPMKDAIVDHGM